MHLLAVQAKSMRSFYYVLILKMVRFSRVGLGRDFGAISNEIRLFGEFENWSDRWVLRKFWVTASIELRNSLIFL